jgi:hypothetical protein
MLHATHIPESLQDFEVLESWTGVVDLTCRSRCFPTPTGVLLPLESRAKLYQLRISCLLSCILEILCLENLSGQSHRLILRGIEQYGQSLVFYPPLRNLGGMRLVDCV